MRTILTALILVSVTLHAQIPRTISFQGVLADVQGNLIPDGNHQLQLVLYDQASGGNQLFIENQTVPVVKGLFNVIIGSVNSIPQGLSFDRAYFLGVRVDGGQELVPRTALTSVPYALHAERANVAESLSPNASGVVTSVNGRDGQLSLVGAGSTTVTNAGNQFTISSTGGSGSGIQGVQNTDGSINVQNGNGPVATIGIASGGVTTDKINHTGALTGQALMFNGSNVGWATPAGGGAGVTSMNFLTGALTLAATGGATISSSGNTLTINAGAGGGGVGIQGVQNTDNSLEILNPNGPTATINVKNQSITSGKIAAGQVVKSINTMKDDVTLAAGSNISITPSGNTLTIAASGGGSGYWAANGNDISNANSGKVGIGTSSPATKLDVRGDLTLEVGSSPTIFTSVSNAEENRYLHIINSPNSPSASGLKAGGLLVSDSYGYANPGKNDLIVKGNVGIGTTNPTGKLEVVGGDALKLTGPGPTVTFKDVLNNNLESYIQGLNGDLVFIPNSFHPNSSAMIIKNVSGNVGIGTTNPQAKLDVAGSLKVNGDAIQDRARGGMVKAMVRVNGNGAIRRSFSANGQAISVSRIATGNYIVDFGFNVSDRFIVCQPAMSPGYSNATRIAFWVAGDGGGVGPNQVVVLTQSWNLNDQDSAFDIFIF